MNKPKIKVIGEVDNPINIKPMGIITIAILITGFVPYV